MFRIDHSSASSSPSTTGRVALAWLFAATVSGCAAASGGGADAGPDGRVSAGDAGDAGQTGSGCGRDGVTQAILCTASSACPRVVVDPDAFPNCGYRIRGPAIELACACDGFICAMGTASTCDDAARLLATQTEMGTCNQVLEGRCEGNGRPAGTGGGVSSLCDRDCLRMCGTNADCKALCNCQ
jgi:hypothetical protein